MKNIDKEFLRDLIFGLVTSVIPFGIGFICGVWSVETWSYVLSYSGSTVNIENGVALLNPAVEKWNSSLKK